MHVSLTVTSLAVALPMVSFGAVLSLDPNAPIPENPLETSSSPIAPSPEEETNPFLTFAALPPPPPPVAIVGGSLLNGDFNDFTGGTTSPGERITYDQLSNWQNIGTGQNQNPVASRTDLDVDGTRNAVISERDDRTHGLDTGYTLTIGETFSFSYQWRDAFNWGATDQITVNLFTTADNSILGTRTLLTSQQSGISTLTNTYEDVVQDDVYTTTALDAGRTLFIEITTQDGNGQITGFARLDNFELISQVPEPSDFGRIAAIISLFFALGRRMRSTIPS